MSKFAQVMVEAMRAREEKHVHYTGLIQERQNDLQEIAAEIDILLDGRRNRKKRA